MPIELPSTSSRARFLIAGSFPLLVSAFFLFVPPIAQDETYHLFADSRLIWSIPNFWNVASNLPFAIVGILGLWKLHGILNRVLFTGVLLTFLGSAYYNLAPSDARLVWDRLPMTLVFMALLTCVLTGGNDTRFNALWCVRDARYLAALATYFIFRWRLAPAPAAVAHC